MYLYSVIIIVIIIIIIIIANLFGIQCFDFCIMSTKLSNRVSTKFLEDFHASLAEGEKQLLKTAH